MIDLHTHILPGVDDGAKTLDDSVAMARVASEDGITTIVATPHRNSWTYNAPREDAEARLNEVRDACRQAGVAIQLVLGGEAYVAPDIANQVRDGLAFTINNGRYVLVEWPFDQYPAYSDQAIFDLQVVGLIPIMAHAERYRVIQRDPERIIPLIERGVLIQVTSGSLLGDLGLEAKRTAETLLVRDMAHVLASDSHSIDRRPPVLNEAYHRAAQLIGEDRARSLVIDTPRQIVDNQDVKLSPPRPPPARPFWAFWKSRH